MKIDGQDLFCELTIGATDGHMIASVVLDGQTILPEGVLSEVLATAKDASKAALWTRGFRAPLVCWGHLGALSPLKNKRPYHIGLIRFGRQQPVPVSSGDLPAPRP